MLYGIGNGIYTYFRIVMQIRALIIGINQKSGNIRCLYSLYIHSSFFHNGCPTRKLCIHHDRDAWLDIGARGGRVNHNQMGEKEIDSDRELLYLVV